jgi:signal transduction histidine kinase/ActR/RegA family two-component response regulator
VPVIVNWLNSLKSAVYQGFSWVASRELTQIQTDLSSFSRFQEFEQRSIPDPFSSTARMTLDYQKISQSSDSEPSPPDVLKQMLAQAHHQLQQQQALARVVTRVRSSLDLTDIFEITTQEVAQFLQADRVAVYRFHPDWSGTFIAEWVAPSWVKLVGPDVQPVWEDTHLQETQGGRYRHGETFALEDVEQAGLQDCHLQLLQQFQARSFAIVPILVEHQLWGLLAAYQNGGPRAWQADEIQLLTQIGEQFGVAVHQADLLARLQQEIEERQRLQVERDQLLLREQAARQAAEAANQVKDEFLAVLSHELRSPLTAILGWTSMLRSRRVDAERTQQALQTIERSARTQLQLIEDLLDISRIIRGQLRLTLQPTNLTQVIQAALDSVQPSAKMRGITLRATLASEASLVLGDPDRLQQIMWNLLTNAIKFTPHGGRVEVRLESQTDTVAILISDTGQGISPDFLPYVFDRFRQAETSTTRTHGGLGLGLAIVQQLVTLHGGSVRAESTGVGQGATFIVQLPLASTPAETPAPQPSSACSPGLQGLRILVVDDDADMGELVTYILQDCGAEVVAVASAGAAIQHLLDATVPKPDVIVSDIGMPEEDGLSLLQRVRALDESQGGRTPALAVTAFARAEDRTAALRAGFNLHLAKPVEPEELVAAIANLVGRVEPESTPEHR